MSVSTSSFLLDVHIWTITPSRGIPIFHHGKNMKVDVFTCTVFLIMSQGTSITTTPPLKAVSSRAITMTFTLVHTTVDIQELGQHDVHMAVDLAAPGQHDVVLQLQLILMDTI